jgi:hypothetical protein
VTVGVTFTEPLAGKVPTPLMLTEVALLAFQLSIVAAPLVTAFGCALSWIAGACPELPDVAIDPPPHPILAIKIENENTSDDMRRTNRIEILPGNKFQAKRLIITLGLVWILSSFGRHSQAKA